MHLIRSRRIWFKSSFLKYWVFLFLFRDHVFAINLSASAERLVPQQVNSPDPQLPVLVISYGSLSHRSALMCVILEYFLFFVFGEGLFRNLIFQMSSSLYGPFKGIIFYTCVAFYIFPWGPLGMLVKVSFTKNSCNFVLHINFPSCRILIQAAFAIVPLRRSCPIIIG